MERKLATLRQVRGIEPIPNAAFIELAIIDGWQCIVKKGEFKVGDVGVYYEIDSFVPGDDPRFEFFRPKFTSYMGKQGMRVKTMKMRKVISQGLFMGKGVFPEIPADAEIGFDVTELLKVVKWEPKGDTEQQPIVKGTRRNFFPRFIRKTDQERIQNYGNIVSRREDSYEVTIKLDGSSLTAYYVGRNSPYFEEALKNKALTMPFFKRLGFRIKNFFKKPDSVYGVCSRNVHLQDNDGSLFWKIVEEKDIIGDLRFINKVEGTSLAIQCELIAPSIQNNHEQVSKPDCYCFDIFDIDNQEYLLPGRRKVILGAYFSETKAAPVIYKNLQLVEELGGPGSNLVQNILDMAEGEGLNPGVKREGLVFKSNTDQNFSFKAVANSYLLAKEARQGDAVD